MVKKNIESYLKKITFLFFFLILPGKGLTIPADSNSSDIKNDNTITKQIERVSEDSHLSLSITPYGTAIKISNRIFYLDKISTEHQNFIISNFLTKGFFVGVLQGIHEYGHYVSAIERIVPVLVGLYEVRNFITNSFFNAKRDEDTGKYLYTRLFSFAYSFIDPFLYALLWPRNTHDWAYTRVKSLSLSRLLIAGINYSIGAVEEHSSETSTQFIPVSLYGDIARLFSIKLSSPKSTHGSPKYDLVRLHLGQPAGNGSYQKLAMAMDELGIDSLSIYPAQHIHAQPSTLHHSGQETDSLVMKFSLPDMDTPSTVEIPLWDARIDELILQAMHKKQDVANLPSARSVLAPDVIQVLSDALAFFKHYQDEQVSTYLSYDPGTSAGSGLGVASQILRQNNGEALFNFTFSDKGSVSIRWQSAAAHNSDWPMLHLDTTQYGEYSQHTQYWVPEWLGDILFMMVDEAANRAGAAIGDKLGGLVASLEATDVERAVEGGLRELQPEVLQDDPNCTICWENHPTLYQLNCRHGQHPDPIHKECLSQWFTEQHRQGDRYRCPMCNGYWFERPQVPRRLNLDFQREG